MTEFPLLDPALAPIVDYLMYKRQTFAVATIIRTIGSSSAKAGARAIITQDGIIHGWVGGGCVQGAIRNAAAQALATHSTRLISVLPGAKLVEIGHKAGDVEGEVQFFKNNCLSEGQVDVFIEPAAPKPELIICGASPVAHALAAIGAQAGFLVAIIADADDRAELLSSANASADTLADLDYEDWNDRFIIVATQGKGDYKALREAVLSDAPYVAMVASAKKGAALRARLTEDGAPADKVARLHAPAGLALGGSQPPEIAIAILAEIIQFRAGAAPGKAEADAA